MLFDSELKPLKDTDNESLETNSSMPNNSLWNISSREPNATNCEQFYVDRLVPPLSMNQIKVGTNLRRVSTIPGREQSFIQMPVAAAQNKVCTNNL